MVPRSKPRWADRVIAATRKGYLMESVCRVEPENRQDETEAEWAEEAKRLASCEDQLQADCRDLERQRRQWELQREEEQRRLDERAEELYARRTELESQRRALEEQRRTGYAPQGTVSAPAAGTREQEPQTSARGLGLDAREYEDPLPNEGPNFPEVSRGEASVGDFVSEKAPFDSNHADALETSASVAEDMESVHEYVEKLLARVRENSRPNRPLPAQTTQPAPAEVSNAWTPKPSVEPPLQASPLRTVPAAAVQRPTDLAAMREIAKLSRELALKRNARRTMRRAARGKLVLLAVTSLAGGLLLAFRQRLHFGDLPIHTALGFFTVSMFCAAQYVVLSLRIVAGNRSAETPSPEPAAQATLPDAPLAASEPVDEVQSA
jgi:hypothetical protein